jgi:cell wall-associated NlpC family hydrolase
MRPVRIVLAALAGLSSACATPATPRPFPSPVRAPAPVAPSDAVVRRALELRGTPYRHGGADPRGFDCSGFVQYVYAQQGVALPRTVGELMAASRPIAENAVAPGDLLFFRIDSSKPSHVAIAINADAFVHAPRAHGVVRVEQLGAPYWQQRFVEARRPAR